MLVSVIFHKNFDIGCIRAFIWLQFSTQKRTVVFVLFNFLYIKLQI